MAQEAEKSLDKLLEKYPEIFRGTTTRDGTKIDFYFECDDGWYDIIDVLCACIKNENEICAARANREGEEFVPVIAAQVKEKFGGLRFYVYGHDDRISGMIKMAESMSYRTCEVCGKPGQLRSYAWVKTHCDEHVNLDHLKHVRDESST